MNRVKELAREILETDGGFDGMVHDGEKVDEVLRLIDNAEECEYAYRSPGGYVGYTGHNSKHPQGPILFFPDPQPTLVEAAQAVVRDSERTDHVSSSRQGRYIAVCDEVLINTLKSVLEREPK